MAEWCYGNWNWKDLEWILPNMNFSGWANEQRMATPGSVVVWEWLFHSTHWLPYEPAVSNYVETVHAQWLARGGSRTWPNQSIVDLKNVSSTLALFVVDLNTMSQTNQSTGTYCCLLGGNRFVQTGFRLYPKTSVGFLVQKKWTVSIPHISTSVTVAA